MDVSRIRGPGGAALTGKSQRAGGAGEGFASLLETRSSDSPSVGASASVSSLNSLLAVQEAESAAERRTKARRRASALLDGLDQIREGLLAGQISPDRLSRLAGTIATEREGVDDPMLEGILGEIELRVHVELAKLGR